jgi:spore germination protein D
MEERHLKSLKRLSVAVLAVLLSVVVIGVGGCNSYTTQQADSRENDNDTKAMILDILHTREGMEALQDIVRDPRLKQSLTITKQDVQTATINALSDPKQNMDLMEQMKNPKFNATITKAYRSDNTKVMKSLLQDPEYQTMMLAQLKSPQFQLLLYDLMKTPEYRKQAVAIMKQAMENPDFKIKMLQIVKQSIQSSKGEQQQQQGKSQTQEQQQGQKQDQGEQKDQEGGGKEQSSESGGGGGGS